MLIAVLVQQVCADISNGSYREQEHAARSAIRRSTKSMKTKATKQSKGSKEKNKNNTSKKSKQSKLLVPTSSTNPACVSNHLTFVRNLKLGKDDSNAAEVQMSDCKEYCSLLSQAQKRCPYASNGHGGQVEDCLTSCLGAAFSHDGTDQDFGLSDTIQCRMNHAKMAIKERALTNSQHCLHASIPGPRRCIEDAEAIRASKTVEMGKTSFYYISASLQAVGCDSSKVTQTFLLAVSYLIVLRERLYVSYPNIDMFTHNLL